VPDRSSRPSTLRPRRWLATALATALVAAAAPLLAGAPATAAERADRRGTVVLTTASLVPVGEDVLTTAVSRPARPGSVLRLQVRRGGTWATVAEARQDRRGVARLRLDQPPEGLLQLRAVRSGGSAVRSSPVPVRVAPVEDEIAPVTGQVTGRGPEDIDVSHDSRVVVYTAPVTTSQNGGSTVRTVVHDRVTRSSALLPMPSGTLSQRLPTVSPNGRYVATVSAVGQGPSSGSVDRVTLTDLQTGRASTVPSPLSVTGLDVSSDGRRVAMAGSSWPAAAGVCVHDLSQGGERENDVYLLDRSTGTIACPSSGLDGRLNGRVDSPRLSMDSSVVTFGFRYRDEPNGDFRGELVRWEDGRREFVETPFAKAGDHTDRAAQVLVAIPRVAGPPDDLGLYDVATGATRNLTATDERGSYTGVLSADGAYVFFANADSGVAGATTVPPPVGGDPGCTYRREVATGTTTVAFCGTSSNDTRISSDGRFVVSVDGRYRLLTRFWSR